MKAKSCLFSLLTITACLQAETLETASKMRMNPASDAPVILTLDAGSELTPLTDETLPPEMPPPPRDGGPSESLIPIRAS